MKEAVLLYVEEGKELCRLIEDKLLSEDRCSDDQMVLDIVNKVLYDFIQLDKEFSELYIVEHFEYDEWFISNVYKTMHSMIDKLMNLTYAIHHIASILACNKHGCLNICYSPELAGNYMPPLRHALE